MSKRGEVMQAKDVRIRLEALASAEKAVHMQRFFKTGPGQYGEGDVFWGLTSPQVRGIVKDAWPLDLAEVEVLLEDAVHEVRACAVLILVAQFQKGSAEARKAVIDLYLRRADRVNNWDLVDISCAILGQWLKDKDRGLLYRLAESSCMWEQRMAVVGCLPLIKQGDFKDILALSRQLLSHRHDLMHKALGWMLREVGKKDKATLEAFLTAHVQHMPRTTLRYAIERFAPQERKDWLKR